MAEPTHEHLYQCACGKVLETAPPRTDVSYTVPADIKEAMREAKQSFWDRRDAFSLHPCSETAQAALGLDPMPDPDDDFYRSPSFR